MSIDNKHRYSHDSACASTDEAALILSEIDISILEYPPYHYNNTSEYRKVDNDSLLSSNSTASSVLSSSSRISKIPSAVKSSLKSVKQFVGRKNKSNSKDVSDQDLKSRLKKDNHSALSFSHVFRRTQDESSSAAVSTETENEKNNQRTNRRSSVVHIAYRILRHPHKLIMQSNHDAGHPHSTPLINFNRKDTHPKVSFEKPTCHEPLSRPSTQSDRIISKEKECRILRTSPSFQEDKTPTLYDLAKGNHHLNNDHSNIEQSELSLFRGLVATSLTPLHKRLMNECDRIQAMVILQSDKTSSLFYPQKELLSIVDRLRGMCDMVNWELDFASKKDVKNSISKLDYAIRTYKESLNDPQLTVLTVTRDVATMKHLMNQCVCQYYKIVERAIIIPCDGYVIEGINKRGSSDYDYLINSYHDDKKIDYAQSHIDHMDTDSRWYRLYFINQPNTCTFFGHRESPEDMVIISIKLEIMNNKRYFRMICRDKKNKDTRLLTQGSFLSVQNQPEIADTIWKHVIEKELNIPFSNLKKMTRNMLVSSELENELLKLDENALHNKFKFGVLLIKENQTQEEEWFSNQHDSESFDRFLSILGNKTKLKDYGGFAAGLDTKGGDCGEYTYTQVWNGNQIAYHVSSLIPSKPGDAQQIQRKRHIGNDIVCIIFVEGNQPFNPLAIKSQFLHVFIVVHEEHYLDRKVWRVEIVRLDDVPSFGPSLPEKALFFHEEELSKFLVAKLVNAEYAAMKSRKLSLFQARPREGLFMNIIEKGTKLLNEHNESNTNIQNHIARKFHSKSVSSGSSINSGKSTKPSTPAESVIMPTPSRSSVMKELQGNLVGLARRRSTQDLSDKSKLKSTRGRKAKKLEGSKRSLSELDLIHLTVEEPIVKSKDRFKNRAHHILTAIPRFGNRQTASTLQLPSNNITSTTSLQS